MFDFDAVTSVRTATEAVEFLARDPEAVVIAGGTDVLLDARSGKLAGARLLSIHDVDELRFVRLNSRGDLIIGPLTTFRDLEKSEDIQRRAPILAQAAGEVGGPQIRAMGTIGGNVCNGKTSADTAPSLFALEAVLELTGPEGTRELPVSEFYLSAGKTSRLPTELLTSIRIPYNSYVKCGGSYIKFAQRRAMDIATLSCAALVRLEAGVVSSLRLTFGVAAPTPTRAFEAERAAVGLPVGERLFDVIADSLGELAPRSSWRASKEFRLRLAREISRRAVAEAAKAARRFDVC